MAEPEVDEKGSDHTHRFFRTVTPKTMTLKQTAQIIKVVVVIVIKVVMVVAVWRSDVDSEVI